MGPDSKGMQIRKLSFFKQVVSMTGVTGATRERQGATGCCLTYDKVWLMGEVELYWCSSFPADLLPSTTKKKKKKNAVAVAT